MRLIVGLGNPGREYSETRHNAGFKVVDLLGEELRAAYWKDMAGARVAFVRLGDEDLALVKPQSFMNASGGPVSRLLAEFCVKASDMVVIHDDIDIAIGRVICKRGGGHGGHNGLRSLSDRVGSGAYLRVRVGVGRPPGRMDPADWVLQQLRGDALAEFQSMVPTAAQAVRHILGHGIESAMQEYNADQATGS